MNQKLNDSDPTGEGKPKNKFLKKALIGTGILLLVGTAGTGLYFGGSKAVKFVKKVNTTCEDVKEIKGTVNTINTNVTNAVAGIVTANTKLDTIDLKIDNVGKGVKFIMINGVKVEFTAAQIEKFSHKVKVSEVKKPSGLRKFLHKLGLVKNLNPEEREMKVEGVETTVTESTNNTTTTLGPVQPPRIANPNPQKIELQKPKE